MNEFQSDYVSSPGETLQEALEERSIILADFAGQLGINAELLAEILDGKAPVTPEIAMILEQLLGIPARFWLKRERRYRAFLEGKLLI